METPASQTPGSRTPGFDNPSGTAHPAAAELASRKEKLERQVRVLRKLHKVLLKEAAKTERKIAELTKRVGALDAVVEHEFKGAHDQPDWGDLQIHEAVAALLQDAGGYLTDSQIAAGLAAHGVHIDNTEILRLELNNAAAKGAPLLRVSDKHWGHRDWRREQRPDKPDLYRN